MRILCATIFMFCFFPYVHQAGFCQTSRATEKRIEKELKKLNGAKKKYETKRDLEIRKLLKLYDEAIQEIENSKLSPDIRNTIIKGISEAKSSFQSEAVFSKIPAFQSAYVSFVFQTQKAYANLMKAYDRAIKRVPKNHDVSKQLRDEVDEYAAEINKLDSLEVGRKWNGYRMDYDRGPVYKGVPSKYGDYMKSQRVQNNRVDVEFTLRIDKRNGKFVEGTITQAGGRFVAIVQGEYDGVNLSLKMTRMIRGVDRYFEYSGQVVGNYGILALRGRKTNGVFTTGKIVLETAD